MGRLLKYAVVGIVCLVGLGSRGAVADEISACLLLPTQTHPFFVKMSEAALVKAAELDVKLTISSGVVDGDIAAQVAAIDSCVSQGVKGILLVPTDPVAVVPAVTKAQEAGVLVVALERLLTPNDAADATFATDDLAVGEIAGNWAKAELGGRADDATIAILALTPDLAPFDFLRDQGFMSGFGINQVPVVSCNCDCKQDSCKRSCRQCTRENADGRILGIEEAKDNESDGADAMTRILLRHPDGPRVVFAATERLAVGARQALLQAGKSNGVLIVSTESSCRSVELVKDGTIDATVVVDPGSAAAHGIQAVRVFADTQTRPMATEGKPFFDIDPLLVTDRPHDQVPSLSTDQAVNLCWN